MKRSLCLPAFCLLAGLFVHGAPQAFAQKKNNDAADLARARQHAKDLERKIDQLEATIRKLKGDDRSDDKRIAQLQHEIQERNQKIANLEAAVRKARGDDSSDDQRIAQLRRELKERDERIQQLLKGAPKATPLPAAADPQFAALQRDVERLNQQILDLKKTGDSRAVHSAFFRLKKDAPSSAIASFLDSTPKTLGKLPGVRNIWVGRPNPGDDKSFDVGIIAVFDDADSLRRFVEHQTYRSHVERMRKSWDPLTYNLSRD